MTATKFDWDEFRRSMQGVNFPSTRGDKIRKLRRITVKNGATAAEANTAEARARQLEKKYRLYGEELRRACKEVDGCISAIRSHRLTDGEVREKERQLQECLRKLIRIADQFEP
jgi:hypothetical protein